MSEYITVVIKHENKDAAYGYGMTTEDLPDGEVVAIHFGNALNDEDDKQPLHK